MIAIRPIIWLAIALAISAAIEGRAEDEIRAKTNDNDYREFVKGLVSPNKAPQVFDEDQVRFPTHYDSKAQDQIDGNRQRLYKHCDEALPFLINACTDSRYSLTWKSDSYASNECVGEVCLEIIASHLEVYRDCMPSSYTKMRYYTYSFVPRLGGALGEQVTEERRKITQEWWKTRKGKSLHDLQIEAFDWAIAKRNQEPNSREEVKSLIAAREKLRQSRECLPPRSIPPLAVVHAK
jgi:hypothetical protein